MVKRESEKRGREEIEDLCLKCPEDVRGKCCCVNMIIRGHNVLLDNVPCLYLDLETKRCTVWNDRNKLAPWCLKGEDIYNTGGFPEGCLYLKGHPERESNPKRNIMDVVDSLPMKEAQLIVLEYNNYNNIPFKQYVNYLKGCEKT